MDEGSNGNERQQTDDGENPKLPPPTISKEDSRFQNNGYMLDDLKTGKTHPYEFSDIVGRVFEFSQDPIGSRFIQMKFEAAAMKDKNELFLELKPRALDLTKDKFGNYVIQKFFEHGTALQIKELAEKLFGHVYTLSFDRYGCRVIQKALEVVDMDQKIKIVRELDNHVLACLYDMKASHVIQKCVEYVPEEYISPIVSVCMDQISKLAMDSNGRFIIQTIFKKCKNRMTQIGVIHEVLSSLVIFSKNQFANYLVQSVLEHGTPEDRSKIVEMLAGNMVEMSLHIFGSRVIEKCLILGSHCDRKLILDEILPSRDGNEPPQRKELTETLSGSVLTLSLDLFGFRVIQKALEVGDIDQKIKIVRELENHVNICLYDHKGSQVIQKCVEFVPEEHTGVIVSVCIDQIAKLAQHAHGFIIETILEYCKNPSTQRGVIDRIVSSLAIFAKDHFATYVVQSVLKHGKPEDRSKIVKKLAGKIVEMSLDMYGSDVIEKCLDFGSHCDHKLIVNEILGSTDGKEPLQTMMKDQFGNYIVQKVLQRCNDENRELILSRIKIHGLENSWFD